MLRLLLKLLWMLVWYRSNKKPAEPKERRLRNYREFIFRTQNIITAGVTGKDGIYITYRLPKGKVGCARIEPAEISGQDMLREFWHFLDSDEPRFNTGRQCRSGRY